MHDLLMFLDSILLAVPIAIGLKLDRISRGMLTSGLYLDLKLLS